MEQSTIDDNELTPEAKQTKKQAKAKKVSDLSYIERMQKYVDEVKEAIKYSIVRFDILVISLSTGALILSISYTKGAKLEHLDLAKTAWFLFVLCITSNLISQVTGYINNFYDERVCRNLIRKRKNKPLKGNHAHYEWLCSTFSNTTMILNFISLVSFLVGAWYLILFFNANTYES